MKRKNLILVVFFSLGLLLLSISLIRRPGDVHLSAPTKQEKPKLHTNKVVSNKQLIIRQKGADTFASPILFEDNYEQYIIFQDWVQKLYVNNFKDEAQELIENKLFQDPSPDIQSLIELGGIYKEKGDLYNFKFICQNLLDKFPGNLEVVVAIAHFFSENGDSSYSASVFSNAISINPYDLNFYYSFGDLMEIEGNNEGALNIYIKALDLNNSDPQGYFKIGELYLKTGNLEQAEGYFAKASQSSPEFLELAQELKSLWINK